MRVLLDECVDRRLAREITGHEVITVPDAGWASAKNGDLLALQASSLKTAACMSLKACRGSGICFSRLLPEQ